MNRALASILVNMGVLLFVSGTVFGQSKTSSDSPNPVAEATQSLNDLEAWLAGAKSGAGWKKFLRLDTLRAQAALGEGADRAALGEVLDQFESRTPGLEGPRFLRVRRAVAAWQRSLPSPTLESLPALAREEKARYQVIDATRLASDRKRLATAAAELRRFLGSGPAGRAWRKYLDLDTLDKQLLPDATPDEKALEGMIDHLQADEVGLELPPFTNLRLRLRKYIADTVQATDPKEPTEYAARLDQLAAQLEAYQETPSPKLLQEIGGELAWLERRGQALRLVEAVKQQLAQPNLLFTAKASFMADGLERPISDDEQVRELILGTDFIGTGRSEGQLTFRFVPDPDRALLVAELTGVNRSRLTGYHGPAMIFSTGSAPLKATKLLTIEADGLHGLSTTVDAKLTTQINGIGSQRGGIIGCLVRKVASRRASQQFYQVQAIAQQRVNRRVKRKFEARIASELARANNQFRDRFFGPLVRREIYPDLHFSTTRDRLNVVGLQGDTEQLGAQSAPPDMVGDPDVAMRLHQSTVNNYTAATLAGGTFGQPELEKAAIDLLGEVPERLKPDPGKEDWKITFVDENPITLTIDDGVIELVGRGKKYKSGNRNFPAMNFTVRYKIEKYGKGIKAVRQGEIEILPPGFVPGAGKPLSVPQSGLRKLMATKLEKMFEREMIRPDATELKGDWKKAGPLAITHLSAAGGWISVGWNQDRPAANVAHARSAASSARANAAQ